MPSSHVGARHGFEFRVPARGGRAHAPRARGDVAAAAVGAPLGMLTEDAESSLCQSRCSCRANSSRTRRTLRTCSRTTSPLATFRRSNAPRRRRRLPHWARRRLGNRRRRKSGASGRSKSRLRSSSRRSAPIETNWPSWWRSCSGRWRASSEPAGSTPTTRPGCCTLT
ncbi:hypothetical protein M885DRAFT_28482 [Pelagophyceae sp. CCMP2097]|nr:hypothetical protein M885DRAFT_28482 [Pelagophyceae sp. CCMP2097]